MLAIDIILSVYAALLLSLLSSIFFSADAPITASQIFVFATFLFIFTFIVISSCIGFVVFPAILIGQRKGHLSTLHSVLILSSLIGTIVSLATTGWYLGESWGWLFVLFLGTSTGALGGYLWWRWIGYTETKYNLQKVEHLL